MTTLSSNADVDRTVIPNNVIDCPACNAGILLNNAPVLCCNCGCTIDAKALAE